MNGMVLPTTEWEAVGCAALLVVIFLPFFAVAYWLDKSE